MFKNQDIRFCFIISSYNNEENIENNLKSVIYQKYSNWRAIYINDNSKDETEKLFFDIINRYNVKEKFTYIRNDVNMKQAYCKYNGYQMVDDYEIVCILDGDDWLSNDAVLLNLYNIYKNNPYKVITTNYIVKENDTFRKNVFREYNIVETKSNSLRYCNKWLMFHLKTGYGYLFKSIPESMFKYNNKWLDRCTDLCEMYSIVEYSNGMYKALNLYTYIYNKNNSLMYNNSYYKDRDSKIRKNIERYIKTQPICKYKLPKTYIINLQEKITHKYNMIKQMNIIKNDDYSFIEAVNGKNDRETCMLYEKYINEYYDKEYYLLYNKYNYKNKYNNKKIHCTKSALGLIQSVFLTLEKFLNEDAGDHILLLEDDVYSIKEFNNKLILCDKLMEEKDVIYLGSTTKYNIYDSERLKENIFVDIKKYGSLIYGGYSIILSRKLAKYVVEKGIMEMLKLNMSWDLYLNYIRESTDFTFYLYNKRLFIPEVRKDGIQIKRNNEYYKNSKINLEDYNL